MTQTDEATEPVPEALRVGTGEAATIIGMHSRTVERYVDNNVLRGGRPISPVTLTPIPRSHRWVHAGDVVAMAVDRGRGDQVPSHWQHLIPRQATREAVPA
jgi:hypothetical protein